MGLDSYGNVEVLSEVKAKGKMTMNCYSTKSIHTKHQCSIYEVCA